VAQRFQIGRASVCLWLKQRREEGRDRPRKMDGGPLPVIRDALEAALKRLVESDNHLTLAQYRDKLAEATGICVHPWMVGRALGRLRLTRKKPAPTASSHDAITPRTRRAFFVMLIISVQTKAQPAVLNAVESRLHRETVLEVS
jgi:transposase